MEYVISKEQKQTVTGIRNGFWQKLQKMLPGDVTVLTYADLEDLVERLERVVQPLDDLDNRRMEELIDYYCIFQDSRGFASTWSMWEDPTGKEARVWMCGPHPYAEGSVIEYDASMGNGQPHRVNIEGNRWIDVWVACEKLIVMSGDDHHLFIEGFREKDGVLILRTGS